MLPHLDVWGKEEVKDDKRINTKLHRRRGEAVRATAQPWTCVYRILFPKVCMLPTPHPAPSMERAKLPAQLEVHN